MSTTDSTLIDAIQHDRLAEFDHPAAATICQAIGHRVADEVDAVREILSDAGIEVTAQGDPGARTQRHHATLLVAGGDQAIAAARALGPHGYRPWEPIDGAAERVLRRLRDGLTVARTDDLTMVIEFRWPRSAAAARFPAALIPNENDFALVPLPAPLWPLHLLVRPLRLVAERVGLRPPPGGALGPFLSTPTDLITPLLDLADVTPEDTVVDLGCGDGRILRHAVAERGCAGVGVESNPRLVVEARRLADEAGLGDRIAIIEGDATAGPLPSAAVAGTVFFLFVPAYAVPAAATRVVEQARPGSRIIVHEQHPIPDLPPELDVVSVPLLVGQGVTVAHRTVVSGEDDRFP